jgi:Ca2+-binding EF-hand superfamily protein
MDKELRLAYLTRRKAQINPGEVFAILNAIGADCSPSEQQAVVEAFDEAGGFTCEEFLDIAESLDYSTTAESKVIDALKSIADIDRIHVKHLHHLITVAGTRIGLTSHEAKEVMRFQLGPRALAKPQVSLQEALSLLN